MRSIVLALVALFGISFATAQTDVQFQAHLPFTATEVTFSAYIADSTFNEQSHLNSSALWYVEGKVIPAQNGMVNVLLEKIPTSVFAGNFGKIYLFSYVNGQPLGKLPFHKLPYALIADSSDIASKAYVATYAQDAKFAERADTSDFTVLAGNSRHADTAVISAVAKRAYKSDTADFAHHAGHALGSDASLISQQAIHANKADTAVYAHTSGLSFATNFVNTGGVNTLAIRNEAVVTEKIADAAVTSQKLGVDAVQNQHLADNSVTLDNIAGNSTAVVGSYLTKGAGGLSWEINPQHRTSSVAVYTAAPQSLPTNSRWVVSRVAVDYNLIAVTTPATGQLLTVYNGSTANIVILRAVTWNIDTGLDLTIPAGQSRTLWYSGFNWVVIQ